MQPQSFVGFGVDEQHGAHRPDAIEGVNHVGLHDDSGPPAPTVVLAADGDHAIERDNDLDGVVRVSRHDALGAGNEQEPTLPQVPARLTEPSVRLIFQCLGQQSKPLPSCPSTVAVLFKNFSGNVQSYRSRVGISFGHDGCADQEHDTMAHRVREQVAAKDAARYRQQYEAAKDQVVMLVRPPTTVLPSSIWQWTSTMKSACSSTTTRSLPKPGTSRVPACSRRW